MYLLLLIAIHTSYVVAIFKVYMCVCGGGRGEGVDELYFIMITKRLWYLLALEFI